MTRSKRRLLEHGRRWKASTVVAMLVFTLFGFTAINLAWQLHLEEASRIKSELHGDVLSKWKLAENIKTSCEVDELNTKADRLELAKGRSFELITEDIYTSALKQNLETLHRQDPQNVLDSYLVICTRRVPVLLLGVLTVGQRTDFEVWVRYEVKAPFDSIVIKSFWLGSPQEAVVRE